MSENNLASFDYDPIPPKFITGRDEYLLHQYGYYCRQQYPLAACVDFLTAVKAAMGIVRDHQKPNNHNLGIIIRRGIDGKAVALVEFDELTLPLNETEKWMADNNTSRWPSATANPSSGLSNKTAGSTK